jgi:hypothetical protein
MAARRTSVHVNFMHDLMTPGTRRWTTMDPNRARNRCRGFTFGTFQASQTHRLAPNALRPSWTPAMGYLDEGGDAHAQGEVRHRSGQGVDFVLLDLKPIS